MQVIVTLRLVKKIFERLLQDVIERIIMWEISHGFTWARIFVGKSMFEIVVEKIVQELNEQHGREKQDTAATILVATVSIAVVPGAEILVVEVLMHPYRDYI